MSILKKLVHRSDTNSMLLSSGMVHIDIDTHVDGNGQ